MKKTFLRGIVLSIVGMLGIGSLIATASNEKQVRKASAAGYVEYDILRNSTVYSTGDSKTSGKWSWDFYAYHHEETQDSSWIEYTTHEWNNFRITYNAAGATKKLSYVTFDGRYESTDGSYLVVYVQRNGSSKEVGTINGNTIGACGTNISTYGDTIYLRANVMKADGSESGNGKLYFKTAKFYYANSHTVTFNANGHGSAPAAATVDDGAKVTKPSDLSATGYTFGGWYKEAACTNAWNFNSDTVTADVTLYAKWTANKYTVTLDRQGGTTGSTSATATYGSAMTGISVPTRTGYTFGGYFTDTNGSGTQYYSNTGASSRNYDKTSALTLYAKWTANKYTVTLDRQGGTSGSTSVQATYDSAIPTVNVPSKTGYDFNGYFTGTAGSGTKYISANGSSAKNWDIASATTLYAYWTLKEEIQEVIDAIDYIGEVEYPGDKAAIELAETLYDELDAAYKPLVANYDDLLAARDTYDDYREEAINDTKDLIDDIGYITYPYSKTAIEAAETAYAGLDAEDRVEVTNAQTMFDARSEYNDKKDYALGKVNTAIEGIGEVSYPNSEKAIKDAEKLYAGLDADEQNNTAVPLYNDLVGARNTFNQQRDDAVANVIDAINDISKPFVYPASEEEISTARALFDALGSGERNLATIPNFPTLVDAEKANVVAKQIKATSTVTDPASYELAINQAKEAFKGLTAAQKAFIPEEIVELLSKNDEALAVIDAINNIGNVKYNDKSKQAIDAAREAFDDLDDDQKALVSNQGTLTQAEEDYNKVKEAVEKINAIGAVTYTPECKELLDAAKAAYDALTDYQRSILPIGSLTTLKTDLGIYDAMDKIEKIGELEYTQECKARVQAAREACNLLNTQELAQVTNISKLTKAENDFKAVDAAINKVLEIGVLEYGSVSENKLQAAKTAYNNLTNDQKALYPEEVKEVLDNYEHAYGAIEKIHGIGDFENTDACRNNIQAANDAVNGLDDFEKNLISDSEFERLEDINKAMSVIEKINAIGDVEYAPESKALMNEARNAYNALSNNQKALVVNYDELEDAENMYAHVDAFVRQVNAIGNIGYDKGSKAKIDAAFETLYNLTGNELIITPDEVIDRLMNMQRAYEVMGLIDNVKKVEYSEDYQEHLESARSAYNALTPAQKELVANYGLLEAAEEDYDAIDAVVGLIESINNAGATAKINAARTGYDALTNEQKARFPSKYLTVLRNYEQANEALAKINAIGNLDASEACKARIEEARNFYKGLSSEVKALISENEVKPLVDAEAAIKVIMKINAIGKGQYSYESQALMNRAREAYDALTEDQKLLVSNYLTLTKGETDYAAVNSVVKLINDLGTPRYGEEYKTKLTAARAAYEALTQDQKDIFPADLLAKLVDYEKVYETLEKIHNIDPNNKQDVQDARDAYEALTEDQKVLIDGNEYNELLDAEYQHFAHNSDKGISTMVWIFVGGTLALAAVLSLIVILITRKKKDEDEEKANA